MDSEVKLRKIINLYRDAEIELLRLIAHASRRGAIGTEAYYTRQRREMHRVTALTQRLVTGVEQAVTMEALQAVYEAFEEGLGHRPAYLDEDNIDSPFKAYVNVKAVHLLADTIRTDLHTHNIQVMRDVEDNYRLIVNSVAATKHVTGEAHTTGLQQALNRFADRGITGFTDKSGRRWRIDSYADMAVRTVTHRAAFEGKMQRYQEEGVEIVRISTHPNSAPQCAPFQGKLIALSGDAGDRTVYDLDGTPHTVWVEATMQEALEKGYKHPNCRHTESRYFYGAPEPPAPPEYPKDGYEQEQHQRYLERGVRRWKRREAVAGTAQEAAYARGKVAEWQGAIREHVETHDYLVRLPHREQLRVGVPTR